MDYKEKRCDRSFYKGKAELIALIETNMKANRGFEDVVFVLEYNRI